MEPTPVDATSIVLLLVFSSIALIFLLFFCAYRLFYAGSDRNEYSLIGSDFMGSHSNDVPREFLNDEESLTHLAETYDFTHLSPEEQTAYLKGEEFTQTNPPDFTKVRGKTFTTEDEKLIKDCGINAFQFDLEEDLLNPHYIVADKTELNFHNNDTPYATTTAVLNYPLPVKNRLYSDTVYFETKVFEFNNTDNPNAHFSIGLVTKPYPTSFRLPGYNKFSIGYESTGNLKINKPFPTPLQQHQGDLSEYNALVLPPLQQSDIVGFGYVIPTGTIFITRNGKKILDVMRGCHVDLYPAVGCFSTNAKFQVNLGQLGYVWIEANVRKYGFVSTSDYKKIGGDRGLAALPQYDQAVEDGDKVLDKGEELPPRYPEEELDFFGRSLQNVSRLGTSAQHQKLNEKADSEVQDEFKEPPQEGGSSTITDEPEEVMDLRERIYEQNIQNELSSVSENTPLFVDADLLDYESTELSKQKPKSTDQQEQSTEPQAHLEQVEEQVEEPAVTQPQEQEQIEESQPEQESTEQGLDVTSDAPISQSTEVSQQVAESQEQSEEPSEREGTTDTEQNTTIDTTQETAQDEAQPLIVGESITPTQQGDSPARKANKPKKKKKKSGKKKGKKK